MLTLYVFLYLHIGLTPSIDIHKNEETSFKKLMDYWRHF